LARLREDRIGITPAQRDRARNYVLFGHMSFEEYDRKVNIEIAKKG
jgi:hypothetical protein